MTSKTIQCSLIRSARAPVPERRVAARLAQGARVGPYSIVDCLGVGGMAEVYLAVHAGPSGFAKLLALKIMRPPYARSPQALEMFEDEARVAGLLNHPGVVQVYDFGVERAVHYLAMELVDGPSLARLRARLGPRLLPTPLTLRIMADTCGALHYAHTLRRGGQPLGLVHRDVSLENILVSYAGQTKLCDFGIAKAQNTLSVTRVGALKGKRGYIAPEAITGQGVDHRADLYAVGVTLYTLLTGTKPVRSSAWGTVARPVAPRALNPALPVELERVVLRALELDPRRRFQSAEDLQDALEGVMGHRRVGLPHELAAFLAEVFPRGSDPCHERYLRAIDRYASPCPVLVSPPVSELSARTRATAGTIEASRHQPSVELRALASVVIDRSKTDVSSGRGRLWGLAGMLAIALAALLLICLSPSPRSSAAGRRSEPGACFQTAAERHAERPIVSTRRASPETTRIGRAR